MKYQNPKFISVDGSQVLLETINDEGVAGEYVADCNDIVPLGIELYNRAVKGEFGAVAPYEKYVPSTEELSETARNERDQKLLDLDTIVSNPLRFAGFTDEQKAELAEYRQALLDVPQQSGFPQKITWPVKPNVEKVVL